MSPAAGRAAGLLAAAVVLAADQASKAWILAAFSDGRPPFEPLPFLRILLVWNTGVSFGLLGDGGVPPWTLAALSGAVAAALLAWLLRSRAAPEQVALGLVVGGAVGNAADRLVHGAVVDFLDLHAWGWHWPAFNVADSAIVVGLGVLLSAALFPGRRRPGAD